MVNLPVHVGTIYNKLFVNTEAVIRRAPPTIGDKGLDVFLTNRGTYSLF